MKNTIFLFFFICITNNLFTQTPTDYLHASFHKKRREILRNKMPKNSVAILFANPIRNKSNDVDYLYHQNTNFYYLTGFKEPNAMVLIFSENQTDTKGKVFNEIIYVPKKDPNYEMWHGKQLGVLGVKNTLGFSMVKTSEEFNSENINFKKFDNVFVNKIKNNAHNSAKNKGELSYLVQSFKNKAGYNPSLLLSVPKKRIYELIKNTPVKNSENVLQVINRTAIYYPNLKEDSIIKGYKKAKNNTIKKEFQQKATLKLAQKSNIDTGFLSTKLAEMREIKTPEELKLLTKAIRISAIGQIEVMKAMHPKMSETEIQGIHEFVYKKYGVEREGYPSIVGAGNNGCILHYTKNNKTRVNNDLVLMDLGAEYKGYTADITRTIPANGKFSSEQKAIYNIVLKAQIAGINACKVGNAFWQPGKVAKEIINKGLARLGIITSPKTKHNYFPHGTSHHIGLDVHDPSTFRNLKENMVITVEPGIYIPEGSKCDKKWWGIAIRIEDDVLITKNNPKNLSEEVPKTVEAIEKMMAKKSVLNNWILPNLEE